MQSRVAIVGAGIGGLASAALLAARGCDVTVIDKEEHIGGKARQLDVDGVAIDAGPTVFTLRDVFDRIFDACGASLDNEITIRRADILARHAWSADSHLDLYADPQRSEQAIGEFAGAAAVAGYRSFHAEAQRIYRILDRSFLRGSKMNWPLPLMWRIGLHRFRDLQAIRPYESLWKVLGEHFADPRLRQLYGRYATYCGSSPFQTPATLMLIAHVEAQGVWLIDGGMSALADAIRRLAARHGARFCLGSAVTRIEVERGRACAVRLASGELITADSIIVNADPAAIGAGQFGDQARRALRPMKASARSLSAMVWLANARTTGFPLVRHNVAFSPNYAAEFRAIANGALPSDPSVYVCAQDRDADGDPSPDGRERLQVIVNAPANGDTHEYSSEEKDRCTLAMRRSLARCGLELESAMPHRLLTPNEFSSFLPGTGGAIYGRASHGWAASFLRPGARTRIPGLYCAGGSTHPGAGVPMAALSGQRAAEAVLHDLASTRRSHPVATHGGMSMRSATTGGMA